MKRLRGTAELRLNYAAGYQDALREMKAKWDNDGPTAAIAYIIDNLDPNTTTERNHS